MRIRDIVTEQGVAEGEVFDQEAGIGVDGQSFKFKIRDLVDLAKKYPVTKVDPKQFANQIAGREEDPTQSAARAEQADLQYPIIVVKRANGQLWIADGTHRAHKAILNKLPSINAKIIPIKDMAPFSTKQGVSEGAIDIGSEWMSDTELDQYVPDQLEQEWRELVGYDMEGRPHPLWANMTGGYEPDVNDPQDRANMVKVANKWFAMKRIPGVRFLDVRDADDELEWLVQIGKEEIKISEEPLDWQGTDSGSRQAAQTDHTLDEAEKYIKANYPAVKKYRVRRAEPGHRAQGRTGEFAVSDAHVVGVDGAVDYLQLKKNSMMSGSKQVSRGLGYSWMVMENPSNGIAVLYYQDRGMGSDEIYIAGKDAKKQKQAQQVFIDAGVLPEPRSKQGVAEGSYTTEKQILTRIRQIMYDRKLSGTESNAGELLRLKQKLKDIRNKQGVAEGAEQQLSIQQLATISDEALDRAYGYGRSTPGNTFGWQANLMSAAYAKKIIDSGETSIERIADAIHKGWNVTAKKFVANPDQFSDTAQLRQAGKLDAKLQQRAKLMKINYAELPDHEQEKDRVVARVLLQALKGSTK